jgi:hypothetical protein
VAAPERLDGGTLRAIMARFAGALEEHRDELNSLNVYPVPDGDTGTNMLLTQRSVREAVERISGDDLAELGPAIARASLMGARGNSGVILAQVLRGFTERLGAAGSTGPAELAAALDHASEQAYRAVAHPVEGTVLTVLADAARAAGEAAAAGADLPAVAGAGVQAARASLERTREVLPELRAAGVVDAGGKGILLLLDAVASTVGGVPMTEPVGPAGPVGRQDVAEPERPAFTFEVMYLLEADEDRIPALRARLGEVGDSVVVVGGDGLFKVHVHTNDPDAAVGAARGEADGEARDVQVVDLADQVAEQCVAGTARSVRVAEEQTSALVAVVDGDGLVETFRKMPAEVVRGGPGRNPSVGELVEAVEAAPARAVLVLPNHRNVIPAAERAAVEAGGAGKDVRVVPTRSVPQGLAAALAFNAWTAADENADAMAEAAAASVSAEITRAVRDAQTPAGPVRRGDVLGVVDGEVRVVGSDAADAARRLVGSLRTDDHEIATLIVGAEVPPEDGEAVEAAIREAAPDLRIDVLDGGQPDYPFLIGLE